MRSFAPLSHLHRPMLHPQHFPPPPSPPNPFISLLVSVPGPVSLQPFTWRWWCLWLPLSCLLKHFFLVPLCLDSVKTSISWDSGSFFYSFSFLSSLHAKLLLWKAEEAIWNGFFWHWSWELACLSSSFWKYCDMSWCIEDQRLTVGTPHSTVWGSLASLAAYSLSATTIFIEHNVSAGSC